MAAPGAALRDWLTWHQCPQPPARTCAHAGTYRLQGREGQVASPDVASKRGSVKIWSRLPTWRHGARWHRWSSTSVHASGLTWRRRTWRQSVASRAHLASDTTWRRRTWRQNVASVAIDIRGVAGRGVNTWRHEAQASQHVSSKCVFSRRAICARPQAISLITCIYIYIYMYMFLFIYLFIYSDT